MARGPVVFCPPARANIETLPSGGGEHNHDPTDDDHNAAASTITTRRRRRRRVTSQSQVRDAGGRVADAATGGGRR